MKNAEKVFKIFRRTLTFMFAFAMTAAMLLSGPNLTASAEETDDETPSSVILYGDVDFDGEITTLDALATLKHTVALEKFDGTNTVLMEIADPTHNGSIGTDDALWELKVCVELVSAEEYDGINYLALNHTATVVIDTEGGYQDFYFTPAESGYYYFYSSDVSADTYVDTYGYLLDADGNELAYSDDEDGLNFGIIYNCTAGETYILRTRLYSSDDTGSFYVTVNTFDTSALYYASWGSFYVSVGDSVTMPALAYDYLGNSIDLSNERYTVEWYKWSDYYDTESGVWVEEVSDVLGTGTSYTIEAVDTTDFHNNSDGTYNGYYCTIYEDGVEAYTCYFYIYDSEYIYYYGVSYPEGVLGDSLTLSFYLYDYADNEVDLEDDAFTFEWHKCLDYYDEENGGWVYDFSDVIGEDAEYTIDALEASDFGSYDGNQDNHYLCYVYKNGVEVSTVYIYIYEATQE